MGREGGEVSPQLPPQRPTRPLGTENWQAITQATTPTSPSVVWRRGVALRGRAPNRAARRQVSFDPETMQRRHITLNSRRRPLARARAPAPARRPCARDRNQTF
jgi:hypothetical protein